MSRTTPREVTLEEKAWLAGILDGEGSITLLTSKNTVRKNGDKQNRVFYGIYFVAAENGWIEKAHDIVNRMWNGEGSPIKLQDKKYQVGMFKSNKKMKQFCVRRQETIKTVLRETLPYLTEKEFKAKLLLSFLENRKPYTRVSDEEIEKYVTPVETKRTTLLKEMMP